LLKKPCHFSEKKISKIGKKLRIFEIFFFVILDSCFTNVHTQKRILEQKWSPCVPFRDIDT
jgi:hypothetical protein